MTNMPEQGHRAHDSLRGARKLGLIIPTLYEAANLMPLLLRVTDSLALLNIEYDVIVVDDSSQDGTSVIVSDLAAQDNRIRLLTRTNSRGLAGAVIEGWHQTDADILGVMDADLQHPPEMLPDLWNAILADADIAIASRYALARQRSNWNVFRHLISRAAIWMSFPLQRRGIRVHDPMSGFFLVRRECIKDINLQPQGFKILLEILVRGNIERVKELPFTFGTRHAGKSKAGVKIALQYLSLLAKLATKR
jgi:dolichol-phosphate mannosyltransferase